MKIVNAVLAAVAIPATPSDLLEKACIDNNIDPNGEYTKADQAIVDKCAIDVLLALKSLDSISQGDFSVKLNHTQTDKTITYLSTRNGGFSSGSDGSGSIMDQLNDTPKIRNLSDVW